MANVAGRLQAVWPMLQAGCRLCGQWCRQVAGCVANVAGRLQAVWPMLQAGCRLCGQCCISVAAATVNSHYSFVVQIAPGLKQVQHFSHLPQFERKTRVINLLKE